MIRTLLGGFSNMIKMTILPGALVYNRDTDQFYNTDTVMEIMWYDVHEGHIRFTHEGKRLAMTLDRKNKKLVKRPERKQKQESQSE